jgi:hypothetical protein
LKEPLLQKKYNNNNNSNNFQKKKKIVKNILFSYLMNQVLLKKQYLQKLGLLEYCKKEIQDLLEKELIRKSKSPWG